jgi:hypothetical protein
MVVTLGEIRERFEAAGWRFATGSNERVHVAERACLRVYAPTLRTLLRDLADKYPIETKEA